MKFILFGFLGLSAAVNSELIKISDKYYDKVTLVNPDGTSKTVYTPMDLNPNSPPSSNANSKTITLVVNPTGGSGTNLRVNDSKSGNDN